MEKIAVNSEIEVEIEVTIKVIGGKYKPLILYILIHDGPNRFKDLMSSFNTISQKTLTNQLKELESDGLITRISYNEVPPRVEYFITEKGKTLLPILDLMCEWGEKNISDKYYLINPQCK